MEGFIDVYSDNWNFVNEQTGEIFVPFGANYFDPETGWAPKLWQKFDRDKVQRTLTPGPIPGNRTITIMGSISRAVPDFLGSDKIKVIDD